MKQNPQGVENFTLVLKAGFKFPEWDAMPGFKVAIYLWFLFSQPSDFCLKTDSDQMEELPVCVSN